jgi:hypothetical protein
MSPDPDVLKGLTKAQLLELREQLDRELVTCLLCGNIGALVYRLTSRAGTKAKLPLCLPCFEKHRLPESAKETS